MGNQCDVRHAVDAFGQNVAGLKVFDSLRGHNVIVQKTVVDELRSLMHRFLRNALMARSSISRATGRKESVHRRLDKEENFPEPRDVGEAWEDFINGNGLTHRYIRDQLLIDESILADHRLDRAADDARRSETSDRSALFLTTEKIPNRSLQNQASALIDETIKRFTSEEVLWSTPSADEQWISPGKLPRARRAVIDDGDAFYD